MTEDGAYAAWLDDARLAYETDTEFSSGDWIDVDRRVFSTGISAPSYARIVRLTGVVEAPEVYRLGVWLAVLNRVYGCIPIGQDMQIAQAYIAGVQPQGYGQWKETKP